MGRFKGLITVESESRKDNYIMMRKDKVAALEKAID
jgi:hypothetical protein